MDEVKKLCTSLRRNAKEERVLFHYNGHGVPRPTANGEVWVFNKVGATGSALAGMRGTFWVPPACLWASPSASALREVREVIRVRLGRACGLAH